MQTTDDLRSRMQRSFGDFLKLTEDVLFGQVWSRPGLGPRDRSLITVALLCANFQEVPLRHHLRLARENGVTDDEIRETLMHVAFYAGWPSVMSAMQVALDFLEPVGTPATAGQ